MSAPHLVFRPGKPRQKFEAWVFGAIMALCVAGILVRGPQPAFLWALVLLPLCYLAFTIIGNWEEKDRIREAGFDGDALVLRVIFRPPRRVALSELSDWKLDRLIIRNSEGPDGHWWALSVRDETARKRWYFLVDGSKIDLDAFRSFAPVAIADLEKLHARSRGKGCDFVAIAPPAAADKDLLTPQSGR